MKTISRRQFIAAALSASAAAPVWAGHVPSPAEIENALHEDFETAGGDPHVTGVYQKATKVKPELKLDLVRRSVGHMKWDKAHGSAILLNEDGAVAFCTHGIDPHMDKVDLSFYPEPNVSRDLVCEITAIDDKHDLSFGQIRSPKNGPPFSAGDYGLLPAKDGNPIESLPPGHVVTADDVDKYQFFCVGFSGAARERLYISVGIIGALQDNMKVKGRDFVIFDEEQTKTYYCKMQSHRVIAGFMGPGFSGGEVFCKGGFFWGMVNAVSEDSERVAFTPNYLIRNSYALLHPKDAEAAALAMKLDQMGGLSPACRATPKDFIPPIKIFPLLGF
jgi:hypothetical protein